MLINMLKLGNVQTNVGMVEGKCVLLGLERFGGDSEWGWYTINYTESPLYIGREVLDLQFEEVDLLEHPNLIWEIVGKKLIAIESADPNKKDAVEYISNHTLLSVNEDVSREIGNIDLLGNALFSYIANVDMGLCYTVSTYYNEGDNEYSSSTGYVTIEHQNGVIRFKVDLCLTDIFADELKEDIGDVITKLEPLKDRLTINEYRKIVSLLTDLSLGDVEGGDVLLINSGDMTLEELTNPIEDKEESTEDI